MILVALGANLPSVRYGAPRETLEAGLDMLDRHGVRVLEQAAWYESAPVPAGDQPWFLNTVVRVASAHPPGALLTRLHAVEAELGRVRSVPNAPRAADFDLLDVDGQVTGEDAWPKLPHPRMHARAFVLMPLADLAPDWRHPVLGRSAAALLAEIGPDQVCRRV
jgi:2-amino-4-hydroxy-6-hydroxymethyldihydropteridine diphosphokinase